MGAALVSLGELLPRRDALWAGLSTVLMIARRRETEELKRTKLKSVALETKGNACACTLASC